MVDNRTYQNIYHQEENTPLVTILEVRVDLNQATAIDTRKSPYNIDLAKAAFGATYYPKPGTQWYLKKISGVWTLMARAPQQNPQLDPSFTPSPGDTYIGNEGTTHIVSPGGISSTAFHAIGSSPTDEGHTGIVAGDSNERFIIRDNGVIEWGSGAAATDTNLYRDSANSLKTDDSVTVAGSFKVGAGPVEIDPSSPVAGSVLQYNGTKYVSYTGELPPGEIRIWAGFTAPTNWQICDGTAMSRTTYATLFANIAPVIGTATMTIATPCVVSFTAHGLIAGDRIFFTTTGALPTGLVTDTVYYVISAGLGANSFEISATDGGAAINTTGSQSGVHTLRRAPWGISGSTTFKVPDFRGTTPVGRDSTQTEFGVVGKTGGEKTHTLTTAESPAHIHGTVGPHWVNDGTYTDGGSVAAQGGATYGFFLGSMPSTGGGGAHNNLQPYGSVNFIIKIL